MKFEDLKKQYFIAPNGKIINKKTKKVKKTYISNSGYERVDLYYNGKPIKTSIHRLVAIEYLENPNNLAQVNHKNGNKLDNRVENLEWCSQSQNMKHAYKNNLINKSTTKIYQYDLDGNFIKEWESISDASNKLKINHANIITVALGKTSRKQAGGFVWKYVKGE